ncbi:MAG: carbamoyltransferase HypF [Candidatus Altiarchaeota archaeon]|nr:carbamoyltransferase HypF [Candidatus Altiarchaeota archaeon]
MSSARLLVSGVVQGVGFRPFCFRQAVKRKLKGYVKNLSDAGVEIILEGAAGDIEGFVSDLRHRHPPLARIDDIKESRVRERGYKRFEIIDSGGGGSSGNIPADAAICEKCLKEMRDKKARRFSYEFTSCIECGPRFTSIMKLPYDRHTNSFGMFMMCADCRREYETTEDRRFNYRSICCPKCGPKYFLVDAKGRRVKCESPIEAAGRLIAKGRIVAVKGIGGTHLACDASDDGSVGSLRHRLGRPAHPFAVMSRNLNSIKRYAKVSSFEGKLLTSRERPIVVLDKKGDFNLSELVAPGLHNIGVMLPYTPAQHLLFDGFEGGTMVMTSANIPGEPMIIGGHEAVEKLSGIADYLLLHNLDIVNRCDDSVVRMNAKTPVFIRRSRGFVPQEIELGFKSRKIVLALGGELNNTTCIIRGDKAFMSQHVGDTTKFDTMKFLEGATKHLMDITSVKKPDVVACDLHPRFNTTLLAERLAGKFGAKLVRVQHHHAHMASLTAENKIDGKIICLSLDGVGYGVDGKAWGGEVLLGGYSGFERAGSLKEQRMPGGDLCVEYPARMLAGILFDGLDGKEVEGILERRYSNGFRHGRKEIQVVLKQLEGGFNVHYTSSCGRVLDATASLLGVCHERTYEGEPAMKLESLAKGGKARFDLPVKVKDNVLDTTEIILKALELMEDGKRREDIAASVQKAVADGICGIAVSEARKNRVDYIGLSGGVACNDYITSYIKGEVEKSNLKFIKHSKVPCGDGGISLGQAACAAKS